VNGLAPFGNDLIAVGDFDRAGSVAVSNIAAWNGTSWRALDGGLFASDGFPNVMSVRTAVALDDTSLYVGGSFDVAGTDSVPANYIARWNGTTWYPADAGTDGLVEELVEYRGNLLAVGSFETASSLTASRVAMFDGTLWSAFGIGLDGPAHAVAVLGDDFVVGGFFTKATTSASATIVSPNVVRWSHADQAWEAMGEGLRGEVLDVAVFDGDVYAAGLFESGYGAFTFETADSTGDVGQSASLGVDRSDRWHVAYYDAGAGDLKYAVRSAAGEWTTETVDAAGNVGEFCSLAVTDGGTPHIAYYDASNEDVKYARKVAGTWTLQTLPSTLPMAPGSRGKYCSIALGPGDLPVVAFYHADSMDVRVATQRTGATWTIRPVDRRPEGTDELGIQTAVGVAPDGTEHVAYFTMSPVAGDRGRNLYHAQRAPLDTARYVTETRRVATGSRGLRGYDPAIFVDHLGVAHFVFQGLLSNNGRPYYATKLPSGLYSNLQVTAIASPPTSGFDPSIAVGGDGTIFVSYQFDGALALSSREPGASAFTPRTLTANVGVGATSIRLVNGQTPRIAYYRGTGGNLATAAQGLDTNARRVARFDEASGTWVGLGDASDAGLDWWARTLLSRNGTLLVGGAFTEAGGVDARRIAGWNGSGWDIVTAAFDGVDPDSHVWALVPFRGSVIAAGEFSFADGGPGNYIVDLGL